MLATIDVRIMRQYDGAALWRQMRERVADTGEIALPAVSSAHLTEDGQASIVLIAPNLVPGVGEVFVQNEGLPPADQVTLDGLLDVLRMVVADRVGRLASVWHAEDLDYVFVGSDAPDGVQLESMDEARRAMLWAVLSALATVGAKYPDVQASTPKHFPAVA